MRAPRRLIHEYRNNIFGYPVTQIKGYSASRFYVVSDQRKRQFVF